MSNYRFGFRFISVAVLGLMLLGSGSLLAQCPTGTAGNQGTVCTTGGSGTPGNTFSIPITLTLNSGVTIDTLQFGVSITPNAGAAGLTVNPTFTVAAGIFGGAAPQTTSGAGAVSGQMAISVGWTSAATTMTGAGAPILLGNVVVTIPGTAAAGQSYTIQVTGASAANSTTFTADPLATGPDTTLTVSGPATAPTFTSANSTTFTVGVFGNFTVTATGSPAPTYSESGALPSGVTFNIFHELIGTPAAGTGGVYPITFTATNTAGTATQNFTLTVNEAPAITSTNNTTFVAGAAGTFTVTARGFPAPTFSETGALPGGVTLSAAGVLSGTPGAATGGTYPITITASNGINPPATQNFTLTVNQALAITSANNVSFLVNTAATPFTVTATGFPIPTLTETGALPTGVTFTDNGNRTATLAGTPAAGTANAYTLTITASNGVGTNATQTFTLTVTQAPAITSADITAFVVGTPGTFTVTATGFPAPTFSETGALPTGVTLSAAGVLSGTPAAGTGGNYNITITASNGVNPNAQQAFMLMVDQAPAITSTNSASFLVNTAATPFTVTTTGFPSPALAETGALPTGVTFTDNGNGTATLGGTPAAGTAGAYPITITASNGIGANATQNFTLNVTQAPAITSANNTTFVAGAAGTFTMTATGFPAPTFTVTTGTLPAGVTLTTAGVLSGTPAAGTGNIYNITITASNGIGTPAQQSFTLTVNQAPAFTSAASATFAEGIGTITFTVTATGFPVPTLSESGALPTGLAFNAGTGVISGTPAVGTLGTYPLVFTASNGIGANATQNFTLNVVVQPAVSINQAAGQADPTKNTTINFTATFTEPVTGFTSSDVTITGTATGTKTVTVTGTGTTYNVAVGGLTGSGTVIATIAAGVATGTVTNQTNLASTSTDNTVTFDNVAPTVTVTKAAGQNDPVNAGPINFTVTFSEPVAAFTNANVTLGGTATGTLTAVVTGTGPYNVAVSGMTAGTAGSVIVTIAAGAVTDLAGNATTAAASATVVFDNVPLTVTINQAASPQKDPTNLSPLNFTVVFSKPVTGFSAAGVTLGGTLAGSGTPTVTGSGATYNVAVTISGTFPTGTITATVNAGAATDAAGNTSAASTSTDNTVTFDNVQPTVTIDQAAAQADPAGASPVNFTVVFNEPVTGLPAGGVTFTGTLTGTVTVTGGPTTFNVAVSGLNGTGTLIATIGAGATTDLAGNSNLASTSTDNSVSFDNVPPTVTIDRAPGQTEVTGPAALPINFIAVFSKAVSGFSGTGITLSGTAGATTAVVTGGPTVYNVAVSGMTGSGTVIAVVKANAATSVTGIGNLASTSTQNTVTFDSTPPTAPATLTATAINTNQIGLVWTASTDNIRVAGYRIERCQVTALGPARVATTTCPTFVVVWESGAMETTFNDSGLAPGTSYNYRVSATDGFNTSTPSPVAAATTMVAPDITPPTTPGTLTPAVFSSTQINLSWTASTDPVNVGGAPNGVTGYLIERCQGAACANFAQIATSGALVTTFNDAGLPPSTSFSYRVRATDAAPNLSPFSNTATASTNTPADTTAPTAPSNLSVLAVNKNLIRLSWTASTDPDDAVTQLGYLVERCEGAGCTNFVQIASRPGALTTFNDAPLSANTTYTYRMRTTDAAGNESPFSAVASATTLPGPSTQPPTPPGNLAGLAASPVSFSLSGARLTADSDDSEANFSTKGIVAASTTQINLSWSASTDPVGVSGYLIERCQGAGCVNFAQIATTAGIAYSDTGLIPGTTYNYRVRAIDTAGNVSSFSSVATATTLAGAGDIIPPTAPATPTGTVISTTQINLAWTAATDNIAVTGYIVERCQGPGCVNFATIAKPAGTAYSDTSLFANTSYSYRVRATDAALNVSGFFSIVTATTLAAADTTPPTTPGTLTATPISASEIDLAWGASTDNVAVTGYLVERCPNAGCLNFTQIATVVPPATTYANMGLTASTSYSYRVRATDAAPNVSDYTNVATVTSLAPPPPGGGGGIILPSPSLSVSPSSLSFTAASGTNPASQSFGVSLTNATSWTAAVSFQNGSGWLSLSSSSGGDGANVVVSVNSASLAPDTYNASIALSFSGALAPVATVSVSLKITGTPGASVISLSRSSLQFIARAGSSPAPQTFEVQNTGAGTLGWSASASTTSGANWLSVGPVSGAAPSTLTVTVSSAGLAAGAYYGSITITALAVSNATNSPQVLRVGLAIDSPAVNIGGLVSAAGNPGGGPQTVSPGSLVTLYGTSLSDTTLLATGVSVLPTTLGGVQVLVNGVPAPLLYVSSTQINFQMPTGLSGNTATVVVVKNGVAGLETSVVLAPEAPGIFTLDNSGKGPGAVLNQNSSVNSAENAASSGSVIQIYATGLGATNPPVAAGVPGPLTPPYSLTVQTATVLINGVQAEVLYSGLAPGFAGAYQVNARIPAGTPAGSAVTLQIKIGGGISNIVTIAVR